MLHNEGDVDLRSRGMGEQAGEASVECGVPEPQVEPEGRGGSITDNHFGGKAESIKPSNDIFPDRGVKIMAVPKVLSFAPTIETSEPACPRGGGVRVKFGKKFSKKR
jgi:hypothetical protein